MADFDNIKLEKGLYASGNFTKALESIDPSENYKGTSLEGLDAYQRQLKRFGIKVGGSIGTAVCGWLLDLAGFVEKAPIQTAGAINMLHVVYLWLPMVMNIFVVIVLSRLKVEKANEELEKKKNAIIYEE